MVIYDIVPSSHAQVPGSVTVTAYEEEAHAGSWQVTAYAICTNAS